MSVHIVLVTHGEIGAQLLETARATLGGTVPLETHAFSISLSCDPDKIERKVLAFIDDLKDHDGVLMLTDIFGSTPSNIANRFSDRDDVKIVAGANLPMLIRVYNYADLPLAQLAEKAVSGGHDGVIPCN